QRIKGQQAHGPGALHALQDGLDGAITDFAQHIGRPVDRCGAGAQIAYTGFIFATAGQRYVDRLYTTIALDAEHHGLTRALAYGIDQLLPVIHLDVIDGQQPVAAVQSRRNGWSLGIQLCEHGGYLWPPGAHTQRGQRIRLFDPPLPGRQVQRIVALDTATRFAYTNIQRAGFPQPTDQLQIDRAPTNGAAAVHSENFLARL